MYRWYERAEICYVYLSDLPASAPLDTALRKCRWLYRGWTLQELIAPNNIDFFDQDWNIIGSKQRLANHCIVPQLERITGINSQVLTHHRPLKSVTVAEKMSWAGGRETTRIEDTAYCLLGIFNVNMPLLYGEEENAFRRLQEEIVKSTPDISIFAWTAPRTKDLLQGPDQRIFTGILAESPAAFSATNSFSYYPARRELSVTSQGIKCRVSMHIGPVPGRRGERYVLPLSIRRPDFGLLIGILLKKIGVNQFVREDPHTLIEYRTRVYTAPEDVYCLTEVPMMNPRSLERGLSVPDMRTGVFQVKLPPEMKVRYEGVEPKSQYDVEDRLFIAPDINEWDSCLISLTLNTITQFDVECTLIVMSRAMGRLQYGLVHDEPFHSELNNMGDKLRSQTCSNEWMLRYLVSQDIPKSNSVAIEIPGGNTSAVISVEETWVSVDPDSYNTMFDRMVFSFEIMETKHIPKTTQGEWKIV